MKVSGACISCGRPSQRQCCLCGLFWHPTCAWHALRKVSTSEFHRAVSSFPNVDLKDMKESFKSLGHATWDALSQHVVAVHKSRPPPLASLAASSSARADIHETLQYDFASDANMSLFIIFRFFRVCF